jgi:hypothetical protein
MSATCAGYGEAFPGGKEWKLISLGFADTTEDILFNSN